MRRLVALVVLTLVGLLAQQAPAPKQHFLIRITPTRAEFLESPTKEEERIMGAHFAYLKRVLADGRLVVAGPVLDPKNTFGIIVVEVESEAEARQIMENDPAVKAGVQKGEVLPFRLALLRGR